MSESLRAARHALTLGSTLVVTSVLALAVRLVLPRVLGPHAFGELRLAESVAEMLFIVLTLGVDQQLRQRAALDPTDARRYVIGVAAWRLVLSVVGSTVGVVMLKATGAAPIVVTTFLALAVGQTCLVLNNSFAAYEQAAGDVRWLARTNLAAKLVWTATVVVALTQWRSGPAVAVAGATVEAARCVWMFGRAVRHHHFGPRPDLRLAATAVVTSLPFFVHLLAHSLYARLGIGWLGAVAPEAELGYFGAASTFAAVALLGMPLLSWVLVPSAARADATGDLDGIAAGALRTSLLAVVPLALLFQLYATDLLTIAFGPAYRPAAATLQLLAPTFALAYVSTIAAIVLLQRGRVSLVASISIGGLVLTAALDAFLVPRFWASGAALATLLTEIVVTTALVLAARPAWHLQHLKRTCVALVLAFATAQLVAFRLPAQPALAVLVFVVVLIGVGGVRASDVAFVRLVLARRSTAAPSPEIV